VPSTVITTAHVELSKRRDLIEQPQECRIVHHPTSCLVSRPRGASALTWAFAHERNGVAECLAVHPHFMSKWNCAKMIPVRLGSCYQVSHGRNAFEGPATRRALSASFAKVMALLHGEQTTIDGP
jgi:hypothetical protein